MPETTSLMEIRTFLEARGCAPAPWTTPEAALEALHAQLRKHHTDDDFWCQLKELSRRLDERCFDPRALPELEVLGSATVDRLLDDLRSSLERDPGPSAWKRWLRPGAGFAATVAFLMLGVSISCDNNAPAQGYDNFTVDTWDCQQAADADNITGEDRTRLCELGDYVQTSDAYENDKWRVLQCLPDLDAAYRESLLQSFQTASATELNEMLGQLVNEEWRCGDQYQNASNDSSGGCNDDNDH